MARFIMRDDNPEIPPPYDFPGITIQSFRLPATLSNLQDICDKFLNIGTLEERGFEYRAFLGFVDMEIVTYPRMAFAEPPYSNWGYASQQEIYFRFFVWKFVYASGVLWPEPMPQFCIPFIFVDNSWSMISGRNVIGFPKLMAQFSPATVLGANPFQISVSTPALKSHSSATKLQMEPIISIDPSSGNPQLPDGLWPWLGLEVSLSDPLLEAYLQLLLAAVPDAFATIELKQFRDAESLTEACYQAVVATRFAPSNIGAPQPLPPVTVTVAKYASLNIPRDLGFPADTPIQPLLQYAVTLDLSATGADNLFVR
ncbi:MAG: hypothetical protein JOZ74_08235 [Bradyrhizobium sp.]|nr:hypothetical protein [Bradyrhizobium sp.]